MSGVRQRPEHLLIREYIQGLRDRKRITQEGLRDAFVPVYLEMIPPGDDCPTFEAVHRHDSPDQLRRKDTANLKKLWRAIDGETFFPLAIKEPLIAALDAVGQDLGMELRRRLLHNAGLAYLPVDTSGNGPVLYSELLEEFAALNTQTVADLGDDGVLNSKKTREKVLNSLDKHLALLREIEKNNEA